MLKVQPLIDAIAVFDASLPARNSAWEHAESDADCYKSAMNDRLALEEVCKAFYVVTADRNTLNNCMLCDIDFMRKIAALGEDFK